MKLRILSGIAAALLVASAADASTFDDKAGVIRLDAGLLLSQSFDSSAAVSALPTQVFSVSHSSGYPIYTASTDPIAVAGDAFIEGKGALRVRADRAVLLGDAASLAPLAGSRIEVRFWGRADGAAPALHVLYSRKALDARALMFPNGEVVAIRTGRATSDGWVEYSTGPIDGTTVYGNVISGLLFAPTDAAGPDGATFLVDALEVTKQGGPLLSGATCHIATEAKDCAKGAICEEGACVDSAIAYGALPPADTRADLATRAVFMMTRIQNDRHATAAAMAGFGKTFPAIAAAAATPDAFFRPLVTQIDLARGAHTYAPMPHAYSRLAAGAMYTERYSGNELNACFGIVEKDLAGGGRGWGVYQAVSPSPLAVGDVVDTIDGEPAADWVARIAPEHGMLAADPDSDTAWQGEQLAMATLRFGHSLVVKRCDAGGACTNVTVDLDDARTKSSLAVALQCGPRFKLAVDVPSGADPNAYDAAIEQTDAAGVVTLHTNGEPYENNGKWVTTVQQAFDAAQTQGTFLVDKRRGDGGGGAALETWAKNLRRDPSFGLFFVSRIDHAAIDGPSGFLANVFATCDGKSTAGNCVYAQLESYPAMAGTLPKKTAWLDVLDGSASDMSTYFAKGASGVRIFAPNRTMGLFGGLGEMGALLEGWSSGSVQISDTREGATNQERVAGPWHSGTGVDPDEIIVQKQSDLLAGRDTMLERARAWLAEP